MEEKGFWDRHSLEFLEMAYSTDHREHIEKPDGYGTRTGDCGDTVEFFVTAEQEASLRISFEVKGCIHTAACCNTVIKLAEGLSPEKAWEITPDDVAAYLSTLPEDHYHCAELAVGGFYLALSDVESRSDRPDPNRRFSTF